MKAVLACIVLLLTLHTPSPGQLLLEDFDYTAGTNLTENGWTAHSGSGTNPVTVSSGGLTYSGYFGSGIGNAALVDNTGEDVNKTFTSQTSGTLYFSFLVKVDAVAAGYFIHLGVNATTFAARVFVQAATTGFNFGLSNTSTGTFGTTEYAIGTTYLCVVKYEVSTAGTCTLWVFSSGVPASELDAGTPEVTNTGTGQATVSFIALRQYSGSQNIVVDGIRVGTSWNDAPLPVQLASFTGRISPNSSGVLLEWRTISEINNFGFYVERRHELDQLFSEVANSFVPGSGTTNQPRYYSFTDNTVTSSGLYYYRLKQVDLDGSIHRTEPITVQYLPTSVPEVAPREFLLLQNYPNPFNPATEITFSVEQSGRTTLDVYNLVGQKVAALFDDVAEAGRYYRVRFSASDFSSGVYLYRLQNGLQRDIKKMMLLK